MEELLAKADDYILKHYGHQPNYNWRSADDGKRMIKLVSPDRVATVKLLTGELVIYSSVRVIDLQ